MSLDIRGHGGVLGTQATNNSYDDVIDMIGLEEEHLDVNVEDVEASYESEEFDAPPLDIINMDPGAAREIPSLGIRKTENALHTLPQSLSSPVPATPTSQPPAPISPPATPSPISPAPISAPSTRSILIQTDPIDDLDRYEIDPLAQDNRVRGTANDENIATSSPRPPPRDRSLATRPTPFFTPQSTALPEFDVEAESAFMELRALLEHAREMDRALRDRRRGGGGGGNGGNGASQPHPPSTSAASVAASEEEELTSLRTRLANIQQEHDALAVLSLAGADGKEENRENGTGAGEGEGNGIDALDRLQRAATNMMAKARLQEDMEILESRILAIETRRRLRKAGAGMGTGASPTRSSSKASPHPGSRSRAPTSKPTTASKAKRGMGAYLAPRDVNQSTSRPGSTTTTTTTTTTKTTPEKKNGARSDARPSSSGPSGPTTCIPVTTLKRIVPLRENKRAPGAFAAPTKAAAIKMAETSASRPASARTATPGGGDVPESR